MERALITGISGFAGSHLAWFLLESGVYGAIIAFEDAMRDLLEDVRFIVSGIMTDIMLKVGCGQDERTDYLIESVVGEDTAA